MRLLLFLLLAVSAHALTIPEIVKKTKPACVTVLVKDPTGQVLGHGSGFFYCDDATLLGDAFAAVVTNYHVASFEGKVPLDKLIYELRLPDGQIRYSSIALGDKAHDLALIILGEKASQHPFLHARFQVEAPKPIEEGESVVVIGTPLNADLFGTVSTGIVAGLRGDSQDVVQITAPISPGSSGSPVIDEDGDLIGVCAAIGDPGKSENLNFSINAKFVVALYNAYHNGYYKWQEQEKKAPDSTVHEPAPIPHEP